MFSPRRQVRRDRLTRARSCQCAGICDGHRGGGDGTGRARVMSAHGCDAGSAARRRAVSARALPWPARPSGLLVALALFLLLAVASLSLVPIGKACVAKPGTDGENAPVRAVLDVR